LEPLHAQLRRNPDGEFLLTDFNSTAGTWVNYAPIGPDGIHLQHGDLVHFGSQTYRFSSSTRTMNAKKAPEQAASTDTATNDDAALY
jgi:pSer/pThr/pTyr-binding forkhead associated (FHA) protein